MGLFCMSFKDTPFSFAHQIKDDRLLGFIVYLTYLRGIPSLIELNEVGIKTRYIQQERFLRWDEVRTFASYGAQGTKKSAAVLTYEVSNEHTVVRWSQQMLTNPFLVLESTLNKKEDWNWVIGRVNSIVASRTNLPLLDLSDRGQQHSSSSGRCSQFATKQEVPATLIPSHSRLWRMAVEPEMSREEFDRWLGQLQSYGMARTGLSLMDLDSGTLSNTN